MNDVRYRLFRPGDEEEINRGFNEAFGLQRPLAEWYWKFSAEPEGRWIMLAVDAEERVLAHYAAIPVRLQQGELDVRAGQIVDVYSRAATRSGLATARTFLTTVDTFIEELCVPDKLALCYGFPSKRPLKLGSLRSGYAQVPPQRIHLLRRDAAPAGRWLTWHTVREGFDASAADRLWASARSRYGIAAVRDSAWLGRRFTGREGIDYLHLCAWRRGVPHAYAVARTMGKVLCWAELVWDGHDVRALAVLDRALARYGRDAGYERLEMWLDGDPAATEALAALGWEVLEHPDVWLVVHTFHPEIRPEQVPGRFYVTMSDADLV